MARSDDWGVVTVRGGQRYFSVARRVHDFRQAHPAADGWGIVTELQPSGSPDVVLMRATITSPSGAVVASGYAEEIRSGRGVNSTSAVENAGTSSIGRALAAAGWGGKGAYSSADELAAALGAQRRQEAPQGRRDHPSWKRARAAFEAALAALGTDLPTVDEYTGSRGWGCPADWTNAARDRFLAKAEAGGFEGLLDRDREVEPAAESAR
tara:strand:- start:20 stop:649 length:630 start_codon:yes stop_codon:yes gene_type:complete